MNMKLKKLKPYFITGFTNADASFMISINRVNTLKYKYRVTPLLVFTQYKTERNLLDNINLYFNNKGHIILDKRTNCYNLRFNGIKNIIKYIIPHYDKYPLKGRKQINYEIWKYIVNNMYYNKIHLSLLGIAQIAKLSNYSKTNNNLKKHIIYNISKQLKIINIPDLPFKYIKSNNNNIHPWFISGFIQGDGSLNITFPKKQINFTIGQELDNIKILEEIKEYFNNIGYIYKINNNYYRYTIYKKNDIKNILIPFLKKYKLKGIKGKVIKKHIKYIESNMLNKELEKEIYIISFKGKRRREKGIVYSLLKDKDKTS